MKKEVKQEKTMRLFIGIPLENITYDQLISYVNKTEFNIHGFRWTKAENLHLTVLFLGNMPVEKLDIIKNTINQVVSSSTAFNLYFRNISYGPPGNKKSMIWANYEKNELFNHLVFRLSETLLEQSLHKDPLPHITLARFKGKPCWKTNFDVALPVLPCKTIHLWQSELTEEGPVYTILQSFELMK